MPLEQLVDRLRDTRGHGPNDLHELVYQLALQVQAARAENHALRQSIRHLREGTDP